MEQNVKDKIELTELANKLFMYTDNRQWQLLESEVFTGEILFDMNSLTGNPPVIMQSKAVCDLWKNGFAEIDEVHHQAGHYLITVNENEADIYGYAIALHFKKAATAGNT